MDSPGHRTVGTSTEAALQSIREHIRQFSADTTVEAKVQAVGYLKSLQEGLEAVVVELHETNTQLRRKIEEHARKLEEDARRLRNIFEPAGVITQSPTQSTTPSPAIVRDISRELSLGRDPKPATRVPEKWSHVAGRHLVPHVTSPSASPSPPATEMVTVAPNVTYPMIQIDDVDSCRRYPGRTCWVSTKEETYCIYIDGHILRLWVPTIFVQGADKGVKASKVISHNDPANVRDPNRQRYYVDPQYNPASRDTRNFLHDTNILPVSISRSGRSLYSVAIGGLATIGEDLGLSSAAQKEYARDFYLGHLLPGLIVHQAIRRERGSP
jgi:hypothetical protein